MTSYTEISPNEPDIIPDYVDEKPAPAPAAKMAARLETPLASVADVPVISGAPDAVVPPRTEPIVDVVGDRAVLPPAPESSPAASHRDGECVPNVPDIQPNFISDAEAAALAVPKASPIPDSPPASKSEPKSPWMRWYLAATVLVVSALGILVFSQAVSALALARTLPVWAQYMLLIPLGFCCLATLGVCVSLAHAWFRLRAVQQVDLGALEELRNRAQTRQDGIERFQEARTQLEDYLQRYPLTHQGQAELVRAGIDPANVEDLAKCRHRLVSLGIDSRSWLDDFRTHFQRNLDAAAHSRVNAWSLKAAGCVIASPLPLLDSVLVLGISLKMIKDLCTIYNVRATRTGCVVLLNKAIIAAFIAGVAEDATEVAGGMAAEEIGQMLGEGTLNSMGARIAGVVAPKLGEGAINAFFIRRLGKATIRLLQPLKPKPSK